MLLGTTGVPSSVSTTVGTQTEVQLSLPPAEPHQAESRMLALVVKALTKLPKKVCECERPGWPGKTMGSSLLMPAKGMVSRNAPMSARFCWARLPGAAWQSGREPGSHGYQYCGPGPG